MFQLSDEKKAMAVRGAMANASHILPFLSDKMLLSLARKLIEGIDYEPGRIFMERLLVLLKNRVPQCSPNVQKGIMVSFLTNNFLLGMARKRMFWEQEDLRPPDLFVISPSMRCNLGCYGCYAGMYQKKDDALSFETIDRVLNEAKEIGIHLVVVSGGEPFFREDLLDIFSTHNDVFFQVYTNGTLIDEQVAERLAELGNVLPCISVEGFEKETEERRGPGVFAKVTGAMDNLREAGVLFGFSATATRENNELIVSDEFVDFYVDKGCFIGWYFNYIPIGRKPALELMPTPEQRDYRRRKLNEQREKKNIALADFWNDGPLTGGCIAGGREYFHINSNGDVEPCVFTHFAVDNILDKSFSDVVKSDLFRAIRARQPYDENYLLPCMIIDNPSVLREVVNELGAKPTHSGAETIITELASDLDEYACRYKEIADRSWARECARGEAASDVDRTFPISSVG